VGDDLQLALLISGDYSQLHTLRGVVGEIALGHRIGDGFVGEKGGELSLLLVREKKGGPSFPLRYSPGSASSEPVPPQLIPPSYNSNST